VNIPEKGSEARTRWLRPQAGEVEKEGSNGADAGRLPEPDGGEGLWEKGSVQKLATRGANPGGGKKSISQHGR